MWVSLVSLGLNHIDPSAHRCICRNSCMGLSQYHRAPSTRFQSIVAARGHGHDKCHLLLGDGWNVPAQWPFGAGVTLGADEATGHVPLSNQSHFVDEEVNSVRQQQGLIRMGGRYGDRIGGWKPKEKNHRINMRPQWLLYSVKMIHEIFMAIMGRIILVQWNPIRMGNCIHCLCAG